MLCSFKVTQVYCIKQWWISKWILCGRTCLSCEMTPHGSIVNHLFLFYLVFQTKPVPWLMMSAIYQAVQIRFPWPSFNRIYSLVSSPQFLLTCLAVHLCHIRLLHFLLLPLQFRPTICELCFKAPVTTSSRRMRRRCLDWWWAAASIPHCFLIQPRGGNRLDSISLVVHLPFKHAIRTSSG